MRVGILPDQCEEFKIMEEFNISDISGSAVQAAASKKRRIRPKYVLYGIIALIVVYFIVNSLWWNHYNEKYYLHFIEKNSINGSSLDAISSWGYVPYEYNGEVLTLEYHKPGRNQYTFGIGLCSGYNSNNLLFFDVPFTNDRYSYEICSDVGRFGKVTYSVFFDVYIGNSDISYESFGFDIKENGEFDYYGDGHPELTEEQRQIICYLKDDILALKSELDKMM